MAVRLLRGGLLAIGLASTIVPREAADSDCFVLRSPRLPTACPWQPTQHPPVAREASSLWLAPTQRTTDPRPRRAPALKNLQEGLKLYAQQRYEQAASKFTAAAVPTSPLRDYGSYYAARLGAAAAAVRERAPAISWSSRMRKATSGRRQRWAKPRRIRA